MESRRTYVVSLYGAEGSVVVEAVQRDERARIADLDALPERIRRWEGEDTQAPVIDAGGSTDVH
jgi:hypothetical protein